MPGAYQLYKTCEIIFKVLHQGKSLSLFAWRHGGRGGLKFSIFAITSFLNSPLAADGIVFKTNAIADDSIVWTGSKL